MAPSPRLQSVAACDLPGGSSRAGKKLGAFDFHGLWVRMTMAQKGNEPEPHKDLNRNMKDSCFSALKWKIFGHNFTRCDDLSGGRIRSPELYWPPV